MASISEIYTLLVVEIKDKALTIFNKHHFKSVEDDLKGAFSSLPNGVLHNEDIRAYIHYDVEEFGSTDMLTLYNNHLMNNLENLKTKYQHL